MQNLESLSVEYQIYALGKKLIMFESHVRYETYQNKWYYGIIFFTDNEGDGLLHKDGRYDIIHHHHMDWERLIINNKQGWKDLPFHPGTYRFLPDSIRILDI